jgi:dienelactone hydrolase
LPPAGPAFIFDTIAMKQSSLWTILLPGALTFTAAAAGPLPAPLPGDQMLADYLRVETTRLADRCLADVRSLDDWQSHRAQYRQQLFEMLGLWPLPDKTDLKPVITGTVDRDQFTVEKIHFQSLPGLYVTANLYLPKETPKPAPAILYLCGHARVVTNGTSYGNKTAYQHHGAWFASQGYVCMIVDTIELGEIQGIHHGTYRENMWWWNARGYTPAGVEAWNSMRALDYLETRPEVDKTRFGVTGRSGGGASSWWLAALDDRIKAACPVAGITDLRNHVVDGTVEGHCDCMFIVNTYRWDYPLLAALVAPRPLLIANSDKDSIFPLEGVERLHWKVRKIYDLYKAADKLGLLITEGPHKDTQDLQLPVFRWFNRHLKGEDPLIEMAANKFAAPDQLNVFDHLPADERTSKIHETFVPQAQTPRIPQDASAWRQLREGWMTALKEKIFRGWPDDPPAIELRPAFSVERRGIQFRAYDFNCQPAVSLRLYVAQRAGLTHPERVAFNILDEEGWSKWLALMRVEFSEDLRRESSVSASIHEAGAALDETGFANFQQLLRTNPVVQAYLAPRGIGLTAWDSSPKKRIQIRRRFMLLGQTLDSMRVWDIRRGMLALRNVDGIEKLPLGLQGKRQMAVNALYASLFEQNIARLDLWELPKSHQDGPDYLNVLRFLDIPEALAMALNDSTVHLYQADSAGWNFPAGIVSKLGWDKRKLTLEPQPENLRQAP